MSTQAEITVTINGVTKAVKDFDELADVIKETDGNVKNLNDDLEDTGKKGKKATKDVEEGAKKADKEMGPLQKRFNDLKETVSGFSTDVKNGFSAAFNGIQKFAKGLGLGTKASKGLAIGLSALGLPLLIAAITAIIGYFKNFEGASKALQIVLNSLGAVVQQLGKAFSLLISGDFKGAFNAVKDIGSAVAEAASQTNKLFNAQRKLFEVTKRTTVENANLRKEIEGQRKILEDTTLSLDERLEALEGLNTATEKLGQNQIDLNKAQLADLQAQLALANNYEERRELQLQIADAQAQLIDSETQLQTIRLDAERKEREIRAEEKARAEERQKEREAEREQRIQNAKDVDATLESLRMKLIEDEAEAIRLRLLAEREAAEEQLRAKGATEEQIAQLNQYYDELELVELNKQEEAKAQAQATADKAALDQERAYRDELFNLQDTSGLTQLQRLNRQYGQELNALKRRLEDELITTEQYEQLFTATEEKFAKQREQIAQNEADAKRAIEEQQLMSAAALFGGISQLVGEQSELGKMAAIAEIGIQTYLGAQKAYASLVGIPVIGPGLAAAAAGVAIATGLKNAAAVQSQELPEGEMGGYVMGASHSMGGVPVELEGGEYVINRAAMSVPGVASMARSLNNTARPKFQNGGIVPDIQAQEDMFSRLASTPVKTYVTATDVTSAQEANALIENLSRL